MPINLKVLTATAACLALLASCRSQQPKADAVDNAANETAAPTLPVVDPPLDRAALLFAVIRAASAHTSGVPETDLQRGLDGRRFEVRLRFGCDGQGPGRGDHGWSIDPNGRVLRLRAVPTLSLTDEFVARVAGEEIEAADGFWLERPWLLDAACPASPPATESVGTQGDLRQQGSIAGEAPHQLPSPPARKVGIAHFFTKEDARTHRWDHPLDAVKQLTDGEQVGDEGFNLVLAGRLRPGSDGRVIHCAGDGRERAPECIVSADIDRAWIENPQSKAVMAEWRS